MRLIYSIAISSAVCLASTSASNFGGSCAWVPCSNAVLAPGQDCTTQGCQYNQFCALDPITQSDLCCNSKFYDCKPSSAAQIQLINKSNFCKYKSTIAKNLLVNGDFEDTDCKSKYCTSKTSMIHPAMIASWSTLGSMYGSGLEIDSNRVWPAASGNWSVDLNGKDAYQLSQNVTRLIPGKTYTLTFQVSTNNFCNDMAVKSGLVQVSTPEEWPQSYLGVPGTFSLISGAAGTNSPWQTVVYQFPAVSEAVTVTIGSASTGTGCGPVIDNAVLFQGFC